LAVNNGEPYPQYEPKTITKSKKVTVTKTVTKQPIITKEVREGSGAGVVAPTFFSFVATLLCSVFVVLTIVVG